MEMTEKEKEQALFVLEAIVKSMESEPKAAEVHNLIKINACDAAKAGRKIVCAAAAKSPTPVNLAFCAAAFIIEQALCSGKD